jgi:hypothetical protein
MVELASYSGINWADSAVNTVEAEALEPKSPKAKMLSREGSLQLSALALFD